MSEWSKCKERNDKKSLRLTKNNQNCWVWRTFLSQCLSPVSETYVWWRKEGVSEVWVLHQAPPLLSIIARNDLIQSSCEVKNVWSLTSFPQAEEATLMSNKTFQPKKSRCHDSTYIVFASLIYIIPLQNADVLFMD